MADHLLGSYLRSLLAIMLVQFTRKGFPGGMEGALHLVERSPPIQVGLGHSDLSSCMPATIVGLSRRHRDLCNVIGLNSFC